MVLHGGWRRKDKGEIQGSFASLRMTAKTNNKEQTTVGARNKSRAGGNGEQPWQNKLLFCWRSFGR
jgi:hypothetical protein